MDKGIFSIALPDKSILARLAILSKMLLGILVILLLSNKNFLTLDNFLSESGSAVN